jgi:hypothetical protein
LPSIISGLLVRVAMELAVFLRGLCAGGDRVVSFSFDVLFRESQEKGLVSFRVGGPGGGGC